jgi:hypothetical protein
MKKLAILLLMISPAFAADEPPQAWAPKIEFTLKGSNFDQTMMWISGWSYALTAVGKSNGDRSSAAFCLPSSGFIESRVLLDVLNKKHGGKTITGEQAAATLWLGVTKRYPCK